MKIDAAMADGGQQEDKFHGELTTARGLLADLSTYGPAVGGKTKWGVHVT